MKNFLQSFLIYLFLFVFGIKTLHSQATWSITGNATGTPEISKIMINACCEPEGFNEYVYMKTGSNPFSWDGMQITGSGLNYTTTPNSGAPYNHPVANVFTSSASIAANLNFSVGACGAAVFSVAPNPLPPNSKVIVIMSSNGVSLAPGASCNPNLGALCGQGTIYVLAGNFTSTLAASPGSFGFFKNGACVSLPTVGTVCTTSAKFEFFDPNTGAVICSKEASYNLNNTQNLDGEYILPTGAMGVGACYEIPPTWINSTPCTANAGPNKLLTCTFPSATIGTAAVAGSTYLWSNNVTSATQTVTSAGTYNLTVTNSSACVATSSVTVTAAFTQPNAVIAPTATLTCISPSTTLNTTGTSTGTNFLYTWSGPSGFSSTGLNPVVNQPGTYSLTVTNATTGCTKVANTTVSENTMPPAISSITPVTVNCFTPSPMLTANATGSNLVYFWSPTNQNTASITINVGGTYTVTVTNAINGCIASTSTIVPEDKIPPAVSVTASGTLSCQNNTVVLNTAGTSTGTNFAYNWSGPNNFSSTALTPAAVSIAGAYTLTVTNTINGCTASASTAVLSNNGNVVANAGADQSIGCGILQATIGTVAVAGNTYTWSNGSTNATQIVTSVGIYYLTVTNPASGCTATDNVIVTANNTPPIAQINSSSGLVLTCTNPTTTLTASGGVSYSWGNGISIQSISVANAGTYQVTVTSQNGCTSTSTVLVSEDKMPPTINIATPNVLTCTNPNVTLNASGSSTGANFTYNWSTTNGNIVSSNTNLTTMVDKAGVYNFLVTNISNGCTATSSVTVTANNTLPTVSIATPLLLTCQSQTVQLYGTATTGAAITYNWTTNGGNFVSGQNTLSPTVSKAGTYTLVVTDNTTGCSKFASVIVINDANIPIANAGPDKLLTCNTTVVQLNGAGSSTGSNFTYLWTTSTPTGGNGIVSGGNTAVPFVNQPLVYSLFVTNTTNGCSASDAVLVTQAMPPTIAIGSNSPACVGSTLTLSASGANTYQWTGANNFTSSSSSVSIPNVTASNAGVYTVVATNTVTGCSTSVSTTVQVQNAYVTAYDIVLMRAGTSRTYNLKPAILKANPKIIGNPIPKSVKLSYSLPGNYSVKVPYIIDSTGCSGLVVLFVKVIKNGVGTKPTNLDNDSDNEFSLEIERQKITVFPNPSEGVFQINVPKNLKSYQTQVFDVNGKIILTGENTNEIDLNNFSNGIYFLKIKNEDVEETVKLIKI